jgi:hypothetical protein
MRTHCRASLLVILLEPQSVVFAGNFFMRARCKTGLCTQFIAPQQHTAAPDGTATISVC